LNDLRKQDNNELNRSEGIKNIKITENNFKLDLKNTNTQAVGKSRQNISRGHNLLRNLSTFSRKSNGFDSVNNRMVLQIANLSNMRFYSQEKNKV
jgi:hypothetical protein